MKYIYKNRKKLNFYKKKVKGKKEMKETLRRSLIGWLLLSIPSVSNKIAWWRGSYAAQQPMVAACWRDDVRKTCLPSQNVSFMV